MLVDSQIPEDAPPSIPLRSIAIRKSSAYGAPTGSWLSPPPLKGESGKGRVTNGGVMAIATAMGHNNSPFGRYAPSLAPVGISSHARSTHQTLLLLCPTASAIAIMPPLVPPPLVFFCRGALPPYPRKYPAKGHPPSFGDKIPYAPPPTAPVWGLPPPVSPPPAAAPHSFRFAIIQRPRPLGCGMRS